MVCAGCGNVPFDGNCSCHLIVPDLKKEVEELRRIGRDIAKGASDAARERDTMKENLDAALLKVEIMRGALETIANPDSDTHHVCCANWPDSKGYPCNCDRCTAKAALSTGETEVSQEKDSSGRCVICGNKASNCEC